jgi:hypothetical protein
LERQTLDKVASNHGSTDAADHPRFSNGVRWAGVDNRYFLTAFVPDAQGATSCEYLVGGEAARVGASQAAAGFQYLATRVGLPGGEVAAGQAVERTFTLYGGPKKHDALKSVEPGLDAAVDFGWLSTLALPMLKVLQWFYGVLPNWGVAIILLTILANCCTMAWQSPMDPCCTPKEDFINLCEWIYLYIFTFELMVKILAYGFLLHPGAYLRDAWCQLDFVVVSLAWMPILFPSMGNYSVIRSVRALRPLRALKRVPGMPQMIAALMSAFPKLANVLALCAFIFLVFGIVGMELFKGALRSRCYALSPPPPPAPLLHLVNGVPIDVPAPSPPTASVAAQQALLDAAALGSRARRAAPVGVAPLDEDDFVCSDGGVPGAQGTCEPGEVCLYYGYNPAYGTESFDSITAACMTIFQCVTLEGWVDVMCARRPQHACRDRA